MVAFGMPHMYVYVGRYLLNLSEQMFIERRSYTLTVDSRCDHPDAVRALNHNPLVCKRRPLLHWALQWQLPSFQPACKPAGQRLHQHRQHESDQVREQITIRAKQEQQPLLSQHRGSVTGCLATRSHTNQHGQHVGRG